jgi:intein/homing endonuclease
MEINEETAEIVGAFIGDGCLSKWRAENREVRIVLFTGSWENDLPYYEERILPIIRKGTKSSITPYHRKSENAVLVRIRDKGLVEFLLSLGFNFGKKGERIVIPKVIANDSILAKACVRGIFNTDGSVYRRYTKIYKKHGMKSLSILNHAVIQIKMKSRPLIQQIHDLLVSFGYRPNKIASDGNGSWLVRVNRQDDIEKFFKEIATTHPYHAQRYNNIKRSSPNQMGS